MSQTERRRWQINPETLGLEPEEGADPGTFNAQDLAAQQWPPCPVCGVTIKVDAINVQTSGDHWEIYALGRWQCRNGCDPRPVLQA